MKPGMVVWTAGADGKRIAAQVLEVGSIVVPAGHQMVHLVLADGRELLASPGHRNAGDRTYDLLPAGPTGTYWADGIQLASTLA